MLQQQGRRIKWIPPLPPFRLFRCGSTWPLVCACVSGKWKKMKEYFGFALFVALFHLWDASDRDDTSVGARRRPIAYNMARPSFWRIRRTRVLQYTVIVKYCSYVVRYSSTVKLYCSSIHGIYYIRGGESS
jgi:hypothetical protein